MHIGITHTGSSSSKSQVDLIEIGSAVDLNSLETIDQALKTNGHEFTYIEASKLLSGEAPLDGIDIVLNLSCGLGGPNSEALVPTILDSHGIPYTGSDALSTAMVQDKFSCNSALRGLRLPTPFAVYVDSFDNALVEESFIYPAIVKPNNRRGAVGITESSIVENKGELLAVAEILFEKNLGPLIVEDFVEGRELVIPVIGTPNTDDALEMPIMEVDLQDSPIYGSEFRSTMDGSEIKKALFNIKAVKENLINIAYTAYMGLGLRGWGKVKVRLRKDNTPEIIEVESIPDIASVIPWTNLSAKIAGIETHEVVRILLESANNKSNIREN